MLLGATGTGRGGGGAGRELALIWQQVKGAYSGRRVSRIKERAGIGVKPLWAGADRPGCRGSPGAWRRGPRNQERETLGW